MFLTERPGYAIAIFKTMWESSKFHISLPLAYLNSPDMLSNQILFAQYTSHLNAANGKSS